MNRFHLYFVSLICIVVTFAAARAADGPPVAATRPVVDDYFGTKVTDPYRYFENLSDPQVQAWIKGQADYARKMLHAIPGRDNLLKRIAELDEGAPYRIWVIRRWPDGGLHYLKRLASENIDKLYFRDANGQEKLLVDPDRFADAAKKEHYTLSFSCPSPDRRFVVYGVAASGSEHATLHVLDCNTGHDLPDTIDRIEDAYMPPRWLPDSRQFVYGRRQKLPDDAPATDGYKHTRSYLHRLGANPDDDAVVFSMEQPGGLGISDTDFPAVDIEMGSRFVIGQIKHGDARELTLYTEPLEALLSGAASWKKVCDVEDGVEEFHVHGDDVYLRTAAGAARYRIVRTSLADPGFAGAEPVLPEMPTVIESFEAASDGLYVNLLDAGIEKVARMPYGSPGHAQAISTPAGASSMVTIAAGVDVDGALLITSSWVRGGTILAFDPRAQTMADTGLEPLGKFDNVDGYESIEVMVPSHDGVQVPLSIYHKTGIALDGSHPTLVTGYGSYGISLTTYFSPSSLAWMERGGVLAVAHVRGGGEFGKEWHLAGQKATKPNTWKDFIACCKYLVRQGYTSPAKLAGRGGSAGGILIGRAITERPDLFAAALDQVGCADMLRFETTTNGVPNIPEFGTVTTKEGFNALMAMSPYHHIQDGVKYPAVLLTHGIHDPRVEPWESAKMTARLQAATASGKPILFRVDYDAGHGIGSTRRQHEEELADQWAFLLWQMGEKGFQP